MVQSKKVLEVSSFESLKNGETVKIVWEDT